MKKLFRSRHNGFAIPLAMVAIMLLLVLGTSLLTLGANARIFSLINNSEIAAQCAADAGLTKALYDMNAKLSTSPWNDSTLPSASDVSLPASDLTFSYNITKNASGIYTIESTGNSGSMIKTVYGPLAINGPQYAILVANSLYMKNNGVITGSCVTLSTASGAFDVKKGTVIGDAYVGVGGNPANINCTVQGRKSALTSPIPLDDVSVPSAAQTAGPNTNWNTPSNATLGTPGATTYVRYSNVAINGTLYISGDVVMYVDGNLSSIGSGINVNHNSSLKLFIGGNFGPGGNGVDLASTDNDPSVLRIYGVGTTSQEFTLGKNNATIAASIYAPKADVTIGKNNATYTGQIIANSFSCKNNADVGYDPRVAKNYGQSDPLAKFVVKGWHEEKPERKQ
jgi:hypothetical protein